MVSTGVCMEGVGVGESKEILPEDSCFACTVHVPFEASVFCGGPRDKGQKVCCT